MHDMLLTDCIVTYFFRNCVLRHTYPFMSCYELPDESRRALQVIAYITALNSLHTCLHRFCVPRFISLSSQKSCITLFFLFFFQGGGCSLIPIPKGTLKEKTTKGGLKVFEFSV